MVQLRRFSLLLWLLLTVLFSAAGYRWFLLDAVTPATAAPTNHPPTAIQRVSADTPAAKQALTQKDSVDTANMPDSAQCQLPDPQQHRSAQQALLPPLEDYLYQQLANGADFWTLQRMLPDNASRQMLKSAAMQLTAARATRPIRLSDAEPALQQLDALYRQFQQATDDNGRRQAIHHLKQSQLMQQTIVWNDSKNTTGHSARGILLAMLEDHPQLRTEALADIKLIPEDYWVGLATLTPEQVAELLRYSEQLQSFRRGVYNLADMAVAFLRPDLLPVLAQYGVEPTNQPGVFSALDLALVTAGWITEKSTEPLSTQRRQTIQYLLARGYSLNASLQRDNHGRNYLQLYRDDVSSNDTNEQGPVIYQPALLALLADYPLTMPQVEPATPELQAFLTPLQQLNQQFNDAKTQCEQQQSRTQQQQQLWSEQQINQQLTALRQIAGADTSHWTIAHQLDPALLDRFWQNQQRRTATMSSKLSRAELVAAFASAGQRSLQSTPTDQRDALLADNNKLLFALQQDATLAADWPNLPLSSLQGLFKGKDTLPFWQALASAGFDMQLQDQYGRTLYPQAFAAGPAAVQWLLTQKVPVDQPLYGPDALDLALDASYRANQLHPALREILAQSRQLEPSHQQRLARLAKFRPALFADLQQQWQQAGQHWPALPALTDVEPNPLLSL